MSYTDRSLAATAYRPGVGRVNARYASGGRMEWFGVLEFTAEELRGIALALGWRDKSADEMEKLADFVDDQNGVERR